jgi:hypothetical protein
MQESQQKSKLSRPVSMRAGEVGEQGEEEVEDKENLADIKLVIG